MIQSEFGSRLGNNTLSGRANRVCHTNVRHESGSEEGLFTSKRAIYELVDQYEIAGLVLFLQRPNSRERNHSIDPSSLKRFDVGSVVDLGGRDAVTSAVSREKDEAVTVEIAYE
jgi:hypothetical protein